jgi:hypothetical protein
MFGTIFRDAIRFLLPGLRVFTLKASEATKLTHILTCKELVKLLTYFITEERNCVTNTLNTSIESRQSAGIFKQLILDDVLNKASSMERLQCYKTRLLLTTKFDIRLIKVRCVYGTNKKICTLKIGRDRDKEPSLYVKTVREQIGKDDSTYDLKIVEPILMKKGEPITISLEVEGSDMMPPVPPSTFDLRSSGATTRAIFVEMEFDKLRTVIMLYGFTYRIERIHSKSIVKRGSKNEKLVG